MDTKSKNQNACSKKTSGLGNFGGAGTGRKTVAFSLTLDPSPAGRGKRAVITGRWCGILPSSGHGISQQRQTVLPLPAGEGRGEGERAGNNITMLGEKITTT